MSQTNMRLDSLTPEQKTLMAVVRDEWTRFALGGVTAIDKERCREGIEWIYSLAKLPPPRLVAFAEGPLAAQIIASVFPRVYEALPMRLDRASVGDNVQASVQASVRDSVRDSVGDSVWASVWDNVQASVWDSVWDSVGASVWDSVWNSVGASVGKHYETPWRGVGEDAGWCSFYDFFLRCGLRHEVFDRYQKWILTGAWNVLWFKNLAVVTCRPSLVKKDSRGRLHCENGPAAQWPSGENYWFWHGVRVNEKIIMRPEEITPDDIKGQTNSEVSRAIAEKLGWDEYMRRAGTKLIHKSFDPRTRCHYELWDFVKRWDLTPRLLKMESPELNDGTRPCYIEPVDPGLETCEAARRWQCDPEGESYRGKEQDWVKECNQNTTLVFDVET